MHRLLTHGSGPTSVRGKLFYHGGATGYMPKRQSLCNCGLYEKSLGSGRYISRMSHGRASIPICFSFGGGHGHNYSKESLGFCRENSSVAEVDNIRGGHFTRYPKWHPNPNRNPNRSSKIPNGY